MEDEFGHGHSVAAWVGVGILIVGSTFIAVGQFFTIMWCTWLGVVLCVVGLIAWVAMNVAGYGEDMHAVKDHENA